MNEILILRILLGLFAFSFCLLYFMYLATKEQLEITREYKQLSDDAYEKQNQIFEELSVKTAEIKRILNIDD